MWVETPRLIIREFQRGDWRNFAPILADRQVMKFSPCGCLSTSQTQEKIETFLTSYKQYGFGKWAVIYKPNQALIGYCGIEIEQIDNKEEKEIGYRLDRRFWGQGLATEAAASTIGYGFDRFEFPYILGIVEPANIASVRVLKKIGMRYDGETVFQGVKMDVYRIDNPDRGNDR